VNEIVFLDTLGLIACWDRSDQWHDHATAALAGLLSDKVRTITTPYVLAECGNAAARKPYRRAVFDLMTVMEDSGRLIRPTEEEWQDAWKSFEQGSAGSAGIVDHLSFMVMRRMRASRVFTNDRHFTAAGLEVLF